MGALVVVLLTHCLNQMSNVKMLQLSTILVSQEHCHSNLYGVSTIEKRIKLRISEL